MRSHAICARMKANSDTESQPPRVTPGAFKAKGACQYLGGISLVSLHRLVERGLLRPNRCLRHLIFSREELDRFLSQ
jgi:hypothetical protein